MAAPMQLLRFRHTEPQNEIRFAPNPCTQSGDAEERPHLGGRGRHGAMRIQLLELPDPGPVQVKTGTAGYSWK